MTLGLVQGQTPSQNQGEILGQGHHTQDRGRDLEAAIPGVDICQDQEDIHVQDQDHTRGQDTPILGQDLGHTVHAQDCPGQGRHVKEGTQEDVLPILLDHLGQGQGRTQSKCDFLIF